MKRFLSILCSVVLLNFFIISPAFAANLFSQSGFLTATSIQYFSAPQTTSIRPTGPFTVMGWFYFTSYDTANEVALFQSGDDSACTGKNWQFYFANPSTITADVCANTGTTELSTAVTSSWTPTANTWYFLAFSVDANGVVGFSVNGVGIASKAGFPTATNTRGSAVFKLGGYSAGGTAQITFDGYTQLDSVWSTALSTTTISANQCTVYTSGTSNLGGQWSLNNVLTDGSGNANTLTAISGATFSATQVAPCTVTATVNTFIRQIISLFGTW